MTVLLDSYCWFEYYSGTATGAKVKQIIDSGEEILVSPMNVFEVYRKFLQKFPKEASSVKNFMAARCKTDDITQETASLAAELSIKYQLHASDAIIYAAAAKHACVLLTGDKHFGKAPNVKFV